MYNFDKKRALVTGAGRGMGRAIALSLAEKGAHVLALDMDQTNLDTLVEENSSIEAVCCDLKDFKGLEKIIKDVLPIDLVVNNAGITRFAPAVDTSLEMFDEIVSVNLKAAMVVTQIVIKDLIARETRGNVVNISSISGQMPLKDHLAYNCSKAALEMMTRVFALEVASKGIRINCVCPTAVMTEMGKFAWGDPIKAAQMLSRIPQGKFAEVEDVVNAVIFLLSDKSDMINGHSLPVDGGQLAT